uniref:Putative conserved secreted protein midgut overexpressed n=1 Tax=Rhipicephalus microplus TaxID=6941 RepID=A0A6M2CIW0_RHIMP
MSTLRTLVSFCHFCLSSIPSNPYCRANMKTTLVILLLALSASGYAATIPADATTNQAALNAFKKSYEVIEKIIADKQQAAEQEESVAETLKALANLQANVDPESEEYFLAQLFQKAVVWLVQKGVSKGVEYGVGKAIKG